VAADLPEHDDDAVETARTRMLRAVDEAVEATRHIADPDRAYAAATLIVEALQQATVVSGRNRAQAVARIRDAEGLSLSALAERLGISKARAEQLINLAKAAGRGVS
jgi:hypothetical protein